MARELDIKNKLKSCKKDIAIQGEIIGLGIQGNKYCLNKLAFYIFNVLDIKTKRYFSLDELIEFCYKYGFTMVPILDTNFTLPDTVLDLVTYSNGTSTLKQCPREGIVIRTLDQKISFKVISPEFLLKNE
jgi:ATP-dependent RNA circularization protein (DNA/RNA ligase family)